MVRYCSVASSLDPRSKDFVYVCTKKTTVETKGESLSREWWNLRRMTTKFGLIWLSNSSSMTNIITLYKIYVRFCVFQDCAYKCTTLYMEYTTLLVVLTARDDVWMLEFISRTTRVHQTVGNRSGLTGYRWNRSGPVPVWSGMKPVQIQNLNLNSKKWKIPKKFLKIFQGAKNLMVSNFLKNSFI